MKKDSIREQLRRNAVALISLVIAITSLGYNTWRNEHSEDNRNQRWASFEVLLRLGDLQELIFLNHFDCNTSLRGNARSGWVMVQTINDLTMVLEGPIGGSAANLMEEWSDNYEHFEYSDTESCRSRSEERRKAGFDAQRDIGLAIKAVRDEAILILERLD